MLDYLLPGAAELGPTPPTYLSRDRGFIDVSPEIVKEVIEKSVASARIPEDPAIKKEKGLLQDAKNLIQFVRKLPPKQ